MYTMSAPNGELWRQLECKKESYDLVLIQSIVQQTIEKRERRKFLFTTRCKTHIKYMRKQRKTSRFCYINNILPCLVQRTCQFYSKSKKQNILIQNVDFYFWFHVRKSLFPSDMYWWMISWKNYPESGLWFGSCLKNLIT